MGVWRSCLVCVGGWGGGWWVGVGVGLFCAVFVCGCLGGGGGRAWVVGVVVGWGWLGPWVLGGGVGGGWVWGMRYGRFPCAMARPASGMHLLPLMLGTVMSAAEQRGAVCTGRSRGHSERLRCDGAFDVVTCARSFHHYPHQARAVA